MLINIEKNDKSAAFFDKESCEKIKSIENEFVVFHSSSWKAFISLAFDVHYPKFSFKI